MPTTSRRYPDTIELEFLNPPSHSTVTSVSLITNIWTLSEEPRRKFWSSTTTDNVWLSAKVLSGSTNVPEKSPLIEVTVVLVIPSQRTVISRSKGTPKSFSINPENVTLLPAITTSEKSLIEILVCPHIV